MKIGAVSIVFALLALPLFATGARVDRFQGESVEAVADLSGPGHSDVVNIAIPAECYVLNATVNVTGLEVNGTYPVAPEVLLNDTVLWAFNGIGYGALGRQDLFSDGKTQVKVPFGVGGGTGSTAMRLPKGAAVQNATLEVNVSGPMAGLVELVNFTGAFRQGLFGYTVSNAGDVNNDGYDDVIVGAHGAMNFTGCAYIYFGGPVMNNTLNVTLAGAAEGDGFGYSVSDAGDVNNDGYSDVVVGAYKNDSSGADAGCAYIYYGGPAMDNTSDVTLADGAPDDWFGCSVSSAGDVNKDGYGDVIVGAGRVMDFTGRAYLYLGGQVMDSTPDVTFNGAAKSDGFGSSVSSAGDVNNDGYEDIIIGAYDSSGNSAGHAYIYFGGPAMNSTPDVTFTGPAAGACFGSSVSTAGDVDNDGYDDVIVGASRDNTGGLHAGRASIYFGGQVMDNIADVALIGAGANDFFGSSVSPAGDMNYDGHDDVMVGASLNDAGGSDAGRVYIYYGGSAMDNTPDVILTGASAADNFGGSVSSAGDVTNDGNNDVIVGAWSNSAGGNYAGRAYIFSSLRGILDPGITMGSRSIWNRTDFFYGTNKTSDFSVALNEYLFSASPSGNDSYGNFFVDVPINISAGSEGDIAIFNLSIVYQYNATVPDFAGPLNKHISAHRGERDAKGNITVPLTVRAQSSGKMRLHGLNITYDGAPLLVQPISNLAIDEDTINYTFLDLYGFFQDYYDPNSALDFSIENATNSSIVNVGIFSNRYLSADALTGDANNNWTGVVSLRIRCTDSRGLSAVSNSFDIIIRNVNDPPVITSTPPANATIGALYVYQLTAVDGDDDPLTFNLLQKPENMTVSAGGEISWDPSQSGMYDVSVVVSDGLASVQQEFSINVESNGSVAQNRIPRFTSVPVTNATVGILYMYNASAVDDDNDTLNFSVVNKPKGMRIDPSTGRINWTPTASQIGDNTITVKVTDGKGGEDEQIFSINVISSARPKCAITSVLNGTKVFGRIMIQGTATKGEASIVSVQCRVDNGMWLVAIDKDKWTYQIDTTGLKNGPHKFEARAFDGGNYSDPASVTLVVDNPQPYISGGNGLWWILTSAVLVMAAAAGLLFWRARRSGTPKR